MKETLIKREEKMEELNPQMYWLRDEERIIVRKFRYFREVSDENDVECLQTFNIKIMFYKNYY